MWVGMTPFGVQYGEVGIDLPRGARIVAIEMRDQTMLVHHVSPDDAPYSGQQVFVCFGGTRVPPDMEFVGMARRRDDTAVYVFHRRDDG